MRALAFLLVLGWLAPASATSVPSKCNAAKYKATGAYAQAILGCQAKALQKAEGIDLRCLAKAITKLEKAFAKAESKGDCAGSEGAATAQSQADAFRIELGDALLAPLRCCAAGNVCHWELDATACSGAGGTPGVDGSVCDGETGQCVTTSPASGPCCENGGACTSGVVSIGDCTGGGGAFVEGGICLETGECLPH